MTGRSHAWRPGGAPAAVLVLGVALAGPAAASGFALWEQGASGLGNAFAGAAAVAEDASTVYWNPAGLARLGPGRHFAVAAHAIMPSTRFGDGGSIPAAGGRPLGSQVGDAGESAVVPNAYFAVQVSPRLSFGLGINVPFGLATDYAQDWIGRFQGIRSELETLNVNPSVSWKVSDRLALGFGVSWQRGRISLLTAVNAPPLAEAQNRVDLEGDAFGWNAGLLLDLGRSTRLGLAYRSAVDYGMDGTTRFTGIPAAVQAVTPALRDGNVRLDVQTPDTASVSVVHELSPRWTLLADVTWTGWDRIRALPIVRDTGAVQDVLRLDFENTLRYAIGASYRLNDAWLLRAGLARDETPVPGPSARSVRVPDNDRTWLTFGARYRFGDGAIDLGCAFIRVADAPIANDQTALGRGAVNGTYEAHVNILSVQYSRTF